jgi:hypothetical protein
MFDDQIPHLDTELVDFPSTDKLGIEKTSIHKPRILLLYGSTRERSFSRLLVEEAARLLEHFGAEARIFNPVVRGAGLVLSRTSRFHERGFQGADRLGATGDGRGTPDPG